jgi:hypothetical protein
MKALFTLIAMICMHSAMANDITELKKGDTHLSQAIAKITNVREMCPSVPGRMRCMAVGSIVTVKVMLNGCLDNFGGYFSKTEMIDGKAVIYFGAINIFNKASMTARCVAQPFKLVELHVPFEGEFELVNMDFTGSSNQ